MDTLNEKMELRITHHDINLCYNLQHLKGKSYYMKAKDDKVRLSQCLPKSSKWLNKDFLTVSGGCGGVARRPSLSNRGGGTRWGIRSRRGLTLGVVVVCIV